MAYLPVSDSSGSLVALRQAASGQTFSAQFVRPFGGPAEPQHGGGNSMQARDLEHPQAELHQSGNAEVRRLVGPCVSMASPIPSEWRGFSVFYPTSVFKCAKPRWLIISEGDEGTQALVRTARCRQSARSRSIRARGSLDFYRHSKVYFVIATCDILGSRVGGRVIDTIAVSLAPGKPSTETHEAWPPAVSPSKRRRTQSQCPSAHLRIQPSVRF